MARYTFHASSLGALCGRNPYKSAYTVFEEVVRLAHPTMLDKTGTQVDRVQAIVEPIARKRAKELKDINAAQADETQATQQLLQQVQAAIQSIQATATTQVQPEATATTVIPSEVTQPEANQVQPEATATTVIPSEVTLAAKRILEEVPTVEVVERAVLGAMRTSNGTEREVDALELLPTLGFRIEASQAFGRVPLSRLGVQVEIRGLMDAKAIDPEGDVCVVEVKNRTRDLFDRIPDYERYQIEFYLRSSGLNYAWWVQRLGTRITDKRQRDFQTKFPASLIHRTERSTLAAVKINRDPRVWEHIQLTTLDVATMIHVLSKNPQEWEPFKNADEEERRAIYQEWMLRVWEVGTEQT